MDKKRIALICLFFISVLAIGYALYRVFFAPSTSVITPPTNILPNNQGANQFPNTPGSTNTRPGTVGNNQTNLPTSGGVYTNPGGVDSPRQITQVTNDYISNASADSNGLKYYNRQDGRFYRMSATGKPELITDQIFYNVSKVTWSPNQQTSILEYPDGANIFYDFASKKQITLPKQWEDFSFAPDGNQIAAKSIGLAPENRWLIAANPDGTDIRLVEPMGDNADKVTVSWSPNKQIIALSATGDPLGADRQQILPIGLNGENFRALTVEGRDLRTSWSPSGKKILYSVYNADNNFKPSLWIDRGDGENIGTGRLFLNVNTWADKCVFDDDRFVYCGVPQTLPRGAGFAPAIADSIPDDIIRIDTETGFRTQIATTEEHTINNMSIDSSNHTLYFTDKNISGVFSVNL
jgi:Tol biopolymer transport system component